MKKFNDPIEDFLNGFFAGVAADKEENARLKFWGIVVLAFVVAANVFIFFF